MSANRSDAGVQHDRRAFVSGSTRTGDFTHLLMPGRIGAMEIRNRLVMSPMETMYGDRHGHPSARTRAYFAARARGGVGLITVGATSVDPLHKESPAGLHIGTDESVPAHRQLVDAVHEYGAKIQVQIAHAGPDGLSPELHRVASLGPSVIPSNLTGHPCEPVTAAQLRQVIDLFKRGAHRAVEAGYDGIELHAAHGYMFVGSFLAPHRNRRTDKYAGGTVDGRMALVFEMLAAIRSVTGRELPITLRISGYERVAGGRPIDETARLAPLLVEAGVDAFHVSGGVIDRLSTRMINGADDGDGLNIGCAAAVKEVVDVPVIAVGRIHDPRLAERILADGFADFVAMGRPMLADPDLMLKLQSQNADRVRLCISCENCVDTMEERFSVECAINPRTGRELIFDVSKASHTKRVIVIGGGPAGIQTALTSAQRGHQVTLFERGHQLGGALIWASTVHPENESFLKYLRTELAGSDVDVRLGRTIDALDIASMRADAVVVATGAKVVLPDIAGRELSRVHSGPALRESLAGRIYQGQLGWQRGAARLLGGRRQRIVRPSLIRAAARLWLPFGHRVAIIGGDLVAVEFAEFLATHGRSVAMFETSTALAPEVGLKRRTEHMDRLDRLNVTVHTGVVVNAIINGGLAFQPQAGPQRNFTCDDVIVAGVPQADESLYQRIMELQPDLEVHAAGDCTGLGLIRKATEDGERIACTL